nr:secretogranin-1 [Misgurnus anguillicaudatus]
MKLVVLVSLVVFLSADGESVPVEQDVRRDDLLTKCLVQILSTALYKTDTTPLHPECNNILKTGSGRSSAVKMSEDKTVESSQGEQIKPRGESKVKEEDIIEDLLKAHAYKREDMHEERSQEEFPSFLKRNIQREEADDERSQEEFPSFVKRRIREKLDEPEDERSQEEFPSMYKRTSKYKKDTEYDRSQEEFPQKRHFPIFHLEKRDNPDDERSQEDFPSYQYKRSHLTAKEKREDPDYDRSQEDFPSYNHKRNPEGEEEEEESREKRIWKPSHRYHYKKKHHKRSDDLQNQDLQDEDYERSQEDFPSYPHKRNHGTSDFLEKKSEEVDEDIEKRYWKPTHRYHYKKHHKRSGDSSEDDYEKTYESREENEGVDKRIWRPEEDELRNHQSSAEEKEREEALKYLTEKKNELEERLLDKGDVYDKRSPWIYRGYYHPAWYKRNQEEGDQHPYRKLEELAETLRYKRSMHSQESPDQRLPTPEELKELEKLASVDQQMKENQA